MCFFFFLLWSIHTHSLLFGRIASTYSLEVYDPASPEQALAKFALNPYAIHHPNDLDVALIHLKQEETGKDGHAKPKETDARVWVKP